MIVKETLPKEVKETIKEQIGYMLPGLFHQQSDRPVSVQLRESFLTWTLDLNALVQQTLDFKTLVAQMRQGLSLPAQQAGVWHHQILFNGEPRAWAESEVSASGQPRVREVSISPLAKKIDDAIEWVESPAREWAKSPSLHVRLLSLPSLLIHTFWLLEPRNVYVIGALPKFVNLLERQLLDEAAFLEALYANLLSREKRDR
jgi:hypothetical protein